MPDVPSIPQSKTERLVKDSLMLGIASIVCGVTALPAIIYSIRALICLRRESTNKSAYRKVIFSLVFSSCIFGFAFFAVWSAMDAAQKMANTIRCTNNLKILGLTVRIYAGENSDTYPTARWCDILLTNQLDLDPKLYDMTSSLHCPESPKSQRCSYAMNARLVGIKDSGQIASDTVLLFESNAGWNTVGGSEIATARHYAQRLQFVTVDGTVDQVYLKDIEKLRWNPFTNSAAK